ncbi:MAG: hypothetical protein U5K56_02795 [Halioglobus sp.]|nr:hypothetical protein [Halioglobus sp.]
MELTRNELSRAAEAQEASGRALLQQATALESAARLNAVSSVIEHYHLKISSLDSASRKEEAIRAQLKYIDVLEGLLSELSENDRFFRVTSVNKSESVMSQVTRTMLMAKARGFTISIEKMSATNAAEKPNVEFGGDYNQLRFAEKRHTVICATYCRPLFR